MIDTPKTKKPLFRELVEDDLLIHPVFWENKHKTIGSWVAEAADWWDRGGRAEDKPTITSPGDGGRVHVPVSVSHGHGEPLDMMTHLGGAVALRNPERLDDTLQRIREVAPAGAKARPENVLHAALASYALDEMANNFPLTVTAAQVATVRQKLADDPYHIGPEWMAKLGVPGTPSTAATPTSPVSRSVLEVV